MSKCEYSLQRLPQLWHIARKWKSYLQIVIVTVALEAAAIIVLDLHKSRDKTKKWGEKLRHKTPKIKYNCNCR